MSKVKSSNLDKMVKDAQKRLEKHIEKLHAKAMQDAIKDFAEARKRLKLV